MWSALEPKFLVQIMALSFIGHVNLAMLLAYLSLSFIAIKG